MSIICGCDTALAMEHMHMRARTQMGHTGSMSADASIHQADRHRCRLTTPQYTTDGTQDSLTAHTPPASS